MFTGPGKERHFEKEQTRTKDIRVMVQDSSEICWVEFSSVYGLR